AQQAGLRLMVESQRPHANAPASQVLEQAPLAGTTVVVDSEVRVSVSGRGVVVAPGAPMAPLAP
ncbi:MAG TPA: PASTA domain-containing protein, partial [Ktedonobacterales bacterium]